MNKKISIISAVLVTTPFLVFAENQTLGTLITKIINYANLILGLMMGIAVVMFVFYIIKYFIKADADRTQAGQYVMWSLIGFFIILSMWGLVNIIQNTFGLQNENNKPASWTSFTNIFPGGSGGTKSEERDRGRVISVPQGTPLPASNIEFDRVI